MNKLLERPRGSPNEPQIRPYSRLNKNLFGLPPSPPSPPAPVDRPTRERAASSPRREFPEVGGSEASLELPSGTLARGQGPYQAQAGPGFADLGLQAGGWLGEPLAQSPGIDEA